MLKKKTNFYCPWVLTESFIPGSVLRLQRCCHNTTLKFSPPTLLLWCYYLDFDLGKVFDNFLTCTLSLSLVSGSVPNSIVFLARSSTVFSF